MPERQRQRHRAPEGPAAGPSRCAVDGCRLPAAPVAPRRGGQPLCLIHKAIADNKRRYERKLENEPADAVAQLVVLGLSWLGPTIAKATQSRVVPPLQKQPAAAAGCFAVLGLDEKGCTEEMVRRRQREFARILHADLAAKSTADGVGRGLAAQARLAEINAAAADCLKRLREKKT